MTVEQKIDWAASRLRESQSVLVITGAGISADSGLPTYRGIGGLYNDEVTEDGIPVEMALAGEMMAKRPDITWNYIGRIEAACRQASPNDGHRVIADMEKAFDRLWVLTQNVDGFHVDAGSEKLIDIHGDLHDLRCTACSFRTRVGEYAELGHVPPRCPDCWAFLRPDVVLFGEALPPEKVDVLFRELSLGFDIVLSIGTTSVFHYIAEPVKRAARQGRPTVEINPGESEVSGIVDVRIPLGAAEALTRIWAACCSDPECPL